MSQLSKPDLFISILMVDGSFRENVSGLDTWGQQTIGSNHYELIWIEYYNTINPTVTHKLNQYHNFRGITLNRTGTYHSSYCFNAGITASQGDLIVIPDADITVEHNFLEILKQEHQQHSKLVLYVHRYDEPEVNRVQNPPLEHLRAVCTLRHPANFGACLSVRKQWLLAINGYDQHPYFGTGFHANGRDINVRLKNLGLSIMWHPHLHLYHPWHPHTAEYSISYKVQHIIIHYRELNLISKPLEGIDSALNYPLPPSVLQAAQQIYSEKEFFFKKLRKLKNLIFHFLLRLKEPLSLFFLRLQRLK